ncbi:MAG: DEAD/DEAH box helicase, partial [Anaerolineae bacterium]|nr:DEAD/DEAH box helicase [Anaerolineae bacterium]
GDVYKRQVLTHRATRLPPRTLQEIVRHGERGQWGATGFFRAVLEEMNGAPLSETSLSARVKKMESWQPLRPVAERKEVDEEQLVRLLEGGGAFAAHFPGYEYRPQQVSMVRGVVRALNRGQHLLVEAPTGVGKSLAYLLPAVHWAVQNGERVVVSTNTINLQEQLYHKDLPALAAVLPFAFRAALLKGRSHYLCLARLQAMRRQGANTPDKARVLAKILVWLPETENGDGDTLFLPDQAERMIWSQLSADHEGCLPERCRYFQEGLCYFYRARHAAEAAHIVIVNHALLLADVTVQNRALPEYKYLIVDEAHNLESATTEGLSFETNQNRIEQLLAEVGSVEETGRVSGLLAEVLVRCRKAGLPGGLMQQLELRVGRTGIAAARAMRELDIFFNRLEEFVREQEREQNSQYALRLRLTSGVRIQPAWEAIEIAWDNAGALLGAVVEGAERLAQELEGVGGPAASTIEDIQIQITGLARELRETREHLARMITAPDTHTIYWLEWDTERERLELHAAPLHIGPLVEEHLFRKKDAVILTSATLRIASSFDFLRERLNAWDADELVVSSPFDYKSAALVYLVDDIPEPGEQGYQRLVEQGLIALFKATQGRALVLFTSYSQLQATLRAIQAPLAQAGITVQAQGQGISRGQLLEAFRTGERRVLLGTRSFWEGVDVPGEALSCLAIVKLPFSVPSDPIFAARAETFDEPFLEYAVPETILRFLQGFGRLIRTRQDRGVVAVFDRRLITKSYGKLFIESLPDPTIQQGPLSLLPQAAADWLSRRHIIR